MELFFISLISVFFLGLQHKNVQHNKYLYAGIVSALISFMQFYAYRAAASGDWWEFIFMSAGSSIGIVSSMYIHNRLRKRSCAKVK